MEGRRNKEVFLFYLLFEKDEKMKANLKRGGEKNLLF